MSQTEDFLRALWPDELPGHLCFFGLAPSRPKVIEWAASADALAEISARHADGWNCYFTVAAHDRGAAGNGRGTAESAVAIPGLWVDVDIDGEGHKGSGLPTGDADALRILNATGLAPTLTVRTGGGLHGWWLFDEPLTAHAEKERNELASLATSWVATIQTHATAIGDWAVDSVGDLARVLRLPGTFNRKTSVPRPVTFETTGPRYAPSDLADVLVARVRTVAKPACAGECPPEMLEIVNLCMPHLSPERAENYDKWIQIGMALKAAGGEALRTQWHAFSSLSTKYDPADADERWNGFNPTKISVGSLLHAAREDSKRDVLGDVPIGSAWDHASAEPKPTAPAAPSSGSAGGVQGSGKRVGIGVTGRARISNVIDSKGQGPDGAPIDITYYRPLPDVAKVLAEATGNWPRKVGSLLFAVEATGDAYDPEHRPVQFFSKADQLFAWMMKHGDVRWLTGHCKHAATGDKLISATKTEFFEYLKANASPSYSSVEVLPHHPEVRDVYYIPTQLPPPTEELDSSPLWELVNELNPETELDRMLILAAMLTPGWGGPCGARPAFVFTSDHGRGVGKTQTATTLAELWGGCVTVGGNEDWDTVRKRLLGDDSMTKRVIVIDNLKGKLNSGDIEGAITSKNIDGWKPYHGQASRTNRLTWFITANTPSLSKDLADRSIIIKIGKQKHGKDFVRWAAEHIEKHRPMILAELFAILKRLPVCTIAPGNRDRWQSWQDAVLSRLDDGDELAALAIARRPDVDADLSDADEVACALFKLFDDRQHIDYEGKRIFITNGAAYEHLMKMGLVDRGFSRRACSTWLKGLVGNGPLEHFKHVKGEHTRGVLYSGPRAEPDAQPIEIAEVGYHGQ